MEPIRFLCPTCQKKLRVPTEKAGRQIKCPGCQQSVLVPSDDGLPDDEPGELSLMQWITLAGAIVLTLSVAFFFVKPSGQLWRFVGIAGLVTIAVPHHREIWARIRAGVQRITERKQETQPATAKRKARPKTHFIETIPDEPMPAMAHQPMQVMQHTERPQVNTERPRQVVVHHAGRQSGGCLAAFLSFLIPGLGQAASGRIGAGILWFLACSIGGFILAIPTLFIGPILLYVCCIFDAASGGNNQSTTVVIR